MGFDFPLSNKKDVIRKNNYIRFPLWLLYYFNPYDTRDIIKKKLDNFKKKYNKTKFCSLVASHDKTGIRTKIYNEVSKIAPIDCPGKLLHNDDTLKNVFFDDKALYLQQYQFNICPENTKSQGYVTEKLFQSLYSGCIPIYSGWSRDPEPGIINPDVILWFEPDSDNNMLINEIQKMYLNEKLALDFMDKNYFLNGAVEKIHGYLKQYLFQMRQIAEKSCAN
jgi:Fe-S cluster biosynthesis and repair protein YggX